MSEPQRVHGFAFIALANNAGLPLKKEYTERDVSKLLKIRKKNVKLLHNALKPNSNGNFGAGDISKFLDDYGIGPLCPGPVDWEKIIRRNGDGTAQ